MKNKIHNKSIQPIATLRLISSLEVNMKKQYLINCGAFILFLFLSSGCVGVVIKGDMCAVIDNPNISNNKGYVGFTSLDPQTFITEAELLKYWGNPDEIKYNDKGQKQLLYKRNEFRWNGIILMAIVPIPLVVPVGNDFLLFTVENGNISKAYMKNSSGESGLFCWIAPLLHPTNWCEAHANIGVVKNEPLQQFIASKESLIK